MRGWGYDVGYAPWQVLTEGTWSDIVRQNLWNWVFRAGDILERGFIFQVLGTFLVGLWTGRRLMEGRLLDHTRFLARVAGWGLAIGLPLNYALASMIDAGVTPYTAGTLRSATSPRSTTKGGAPRPLESQAETCPRRGDNSRVPLQVEIHDGPLSAREACEPFQEGE